MHGAVAASCVDRRCRGDGKCLAPTKMKRTTADDRRAALANGPPAGNVSAFVLSGNVLANVDLDAGAGGRFGGLEKLLVTSDALSQEYP